MGVFTKSCFSVICFVTVLALQEQANFEIVTGKKVVNATTTIKKVSQFQCASSCLRLATNDKCKVAGYNSGSRECHLSSHMLEAAVTSASDEWKILIPEIATPATTTATSLTTTATPATTTATSLTTTATPSTTTATTSTTTDTPSTTTTTPSTTTATPSTTTATPTTDYPCPRYLVNGLTPVADDQLTASSYYNNPVDEYYQGPAEARLNSVHDTQPTAYNAGVWGAGTLDINQYIQVDFTTSRVVTAIATQGRTAGYTVTDQYVTAYRFLYSDNCVDFTVYNDTNGAAKVFIGNSDTDTVVINPLVCPVSARCVRLNPTTWQGYISMRFDVLGCSTLVSENSTGCSLCTSTGFLVNGPNPVSDDNMTASSILSYDLGYYGASEARLNKTRLPVWGGVNRAGAWVVAVAEPNQHIQVDFEKIRFVTAIATQGRPTHDQYVTAYRLLYSVNCVDFTVYNETNGVAKIFAGNSNRNTIVVNTLLSPVYARCVRINPTAWQGWICMRFDIEGC